MRKYGFFVVSLITIAVLSACTKNNENVKSSKESTVTSVSESIDADNQKIIDDAQKDADDIARKEIEEKEARIAKDEPLVLLNGKVNDIMTKPDSGLDLVRVTVKLDNIENDKNNLFKDKVGKEVEFFFSEKQFKDFKFSDLKKGDNVSIETFQDASLSISEPKQVDTLDIVKIK
ncbi:hypothetical protein [Vagococcus silagei]|uniref:Lipoprotein n=1 Tax=Vagococcus silagei TaxID=2508885 RepID=A0A4S3B2T8_9ENTE|nr:hypothetical protein [Vagococcus silagei]THB61142.1 hypothetical protein ESZ54_06380 [Vagococcus silagei]